MKRLLVLLFLLPTLAHAQGAGTPPYRGVNNWNLIFGTDNLYNIGAVGGQRPANIYAAAGIFSPAITDSGLTATRVTFAGAGGLLSDASTLTFNSGTGVLSATGLTATGQTATRMAFYDTGGALNGSASLTWDGTSLSATRHTAGAADNCTTPPYSFGTDTDTGMCSSAADAIVFRTAGSNRFTINSAGLNAPAGSNIILSDSSVFSASSLRLNTDTTIAREAAAIFQLGLDVNGSTVAYTLKAGDGITGTNIAGAPLTLAGGRATGSGAPGDFIEQTSTPLASGTTAQTLVTRARHVAPFRVLTDATATTLFTIGTGNDISCGGTVFFTVEAADASNQQTTTGEVHFAAADNAAGAGGEACSAAVTGTNATAATSGTLTVTADATTGTDLCNIRLTATGSLTETVGPRARYSLVLNPMSSSCTVTPQ